MQLDCPEAGTGDRRFPLRKSLTAESLDFGRRTTAADFCVNPMTVIEKKRDRPLLVDYGYPFDQIRDQTAVLVLLEGMTAIWRSI